MAKVELDEVELQRLQKQDATVQRIWSHPGAKKKILEAIKTENPNARIPELEVEEAARKPVEELEKTVLELRREISDDKAEREKNAKLSALSGSIEAGKAKLRRAGWFEEDLKALDQIMEEKGTTDIEVAAAYYEKLHPPQTPASPSGGVGGWDFTAPVEDDSYTKKLLSSKSAADNEQLAMNEANKALMEFRGAQQRSR